ncbi:MAG TPA: DNA polymerase III subunit chi [Steroidobacteraceae bacterium]|nr:DNA polymerase III subunit chi [Steroidobacteraceae bacterium]
MTRRVDFYVLGEPTSAGRLRLACRLAEKAYLAGQAVLIWDTDTSELAQLDELLWTFADRSFVPHETVLAPAMAPDAPVLLSSGVVPERRLDVLINLAADVPPCLANVERVADIIDGDEARRRAGRARFRAYRDAGLQLETHEISARQLSG